MTIPPIKDPPDKDFVDQFKSHRDGHTGNRLEFVMDWVRRHPSCTLSSGEGAVLLAEIDRLRAREP